MVMMNQNNFFRKVFPKAHVVLPVIHVVSQKQTFNNVLIAQSAEADGVFLINHEFDFQELLAVQHAVAEAFPDLWIGVNCLDLRPHEVFGHLPSKIAGVWVDNAMIREDQKDQPTAEAVLDARKCANWKGLYFGGVAFKYQRHVEDLRAAVTLAKDYMDVVTTSGPGTGKPAHIEKIHIMKEALGDYPLAIASGITPDNVEEYLPYSDCYLVATGISKDFVEFDPALVQRLVRTVRRYDEMQIS